MNSLRSLDNLSTTTKNTLLFPQTCKQLIDLLYSQLLLFLSLILALP